MRCYTIVIACASVLGSSAAIYLPVKSKDITPDQQARLDALKPLVWVHIPKTGGSFQNVLYQHRGICPFIPADAIFTDLGHIDEFIEQYVTEENCPGGFMHTTQSLDSDLKHVTANVMPHILGHHGIGALDHDQLKGHLVTSLRQPEQHIISAFNMGSFASFGKTLEEYARAEAGWMVKQLTRSGRVWIPEEVELTLPTAEEVQYAKLVLSHDFGFVGITDEFDKSVCLFHAMFGGQCHDFEFENIRPGALYETTANHSGAQDLYNTSELHGFQDVYDGELYSHATKLFNANLKLYGVDSTTCPNLCA